MNYRTLYVTVAQVDVGVAKLNQALLASSAKMHLMKHALIIVRLPDITGRTALAVANAKYHVIKDITNATYNRDPVPVKFKHVY